MTGLLLTPSRGCVAMTRAARTWLKNSGQRTWKFISVGLPLITTSQLGGKWKLITRSKMNKFCSILSTSITWDLRFCPFSNVLLWKVGQQWCTTTWIQIINIWPFSSLCLWFSSDLSLPCNWCLQKLSNLTNEKKRERNRKLLINSKKPKFSLELRKIRESKKKKSYFYQIQIIKIVQIKWLRPV
jgi:hypothetical protein